MSNAIFHSSILFNDPRLLDELINALQSHRQSRNDRVHLQAVSAALRLLKGTLSPLLEQGLIVVAEAPATPLANSVEAWLAWVNNALSLAKQQEAPTASWRLDLIAKLETLKATLSNASESMVLHNILVGVPLMPAITIKTDKTSITTEAVSDETDTPVMAGVGEGGTGSANEVWFSGSDALDL